MNLFPRRKIAKLWPAPVLGVVLQGLGVLLTGDWICKGSKSMLAAVVLIALASFAAKKYGRYFATATLVFAVLFSPLAVKVLAGETLTGPQFYCYAAFCLCLADLLAALALLAGRRHGTARLAVTLLLLPLVLSVGLIWCYYFDADALMTTDTVLAIMQTNLGEAREYLSEHVNFAVAAAVALTGLLYAAQVRMLARLELRRGRLPAYLLLSLAVLGCGTLMYRQRRNFIMDRLYYKINLYIRYYRDFAGQRDYRLQTAIRSLGIQGTSTPGIYLLVLGESQNREHMQAYGYERPTTPWLAQMRNDRHFLLFEKAYSCYPHTVRSLTYALTAKNQYNDLNYKNAVTLLEAAEAAGFSTVWLSNQSHYSPWDTPITVIASEAEQQYWLNGNVGKDWIEAGWTNFFDGALADKLTNIKLTDKTLIVVHLMGNHGAYNERYPKNFAVYKGKNRLDAYDNSILYNDYVMERLFNRVKDLPGFQGLIYCADHAEAVREGSGHDATRYVPAMTRIPMYMYFSDSYVRNNKDKFTLLRQAQRKYFTNDLLFNVVLSVMGIKLEGFYEPRNDLAGAAYDGDRERFRTLHGGKRLEER